MDGQTELYDSQDRASIAASRGKNGNYRVKRGYLEYKNKKQAALVTRFVIGVLQVKKCHVIINNGPSTRLLSIRTNREHGPFQDVFTGGHLGAGSRMVEAWKPRQPKTHHI